MNILWGVGDVNTQLARWTSLKLFGYPDGFREMTTMGVFDDEDLIACMVYHNFDRRSGVIEISGASENPRWLTKPVLWEMFSYPFLQLKCQLVVMRVSSADSRLRRILTAYGFDHVTIPRLRGRDKDETIYTLTDDDWLKNGFHTKSLVVSPASDESAQAA